MIPEIVVKAGAAPVPWGPILGGAASLLGGAFSNAQSRESIRQQQKFQEYMSNTAWQRAVADMRKAGLNPYLAYGQGGASSPSGGAYTASDVVAPAVSSVMGAARLKEEIRLLKQQTASTEADVHRKGYEAQTAEVGLQSAKMQQENIPVERDAIRARARLDEANAMAIRLSLPGLRNEAGFQSQVGILAPWLARVGSAVQMGSKLLPGTAGMLSRAAAAASKVPGYQRY